MCNLNLYIQSIWHIMFTPIVKSASFTMQSPAALPWTYSVCHVQQLCVQKENQRELSINLDTFIKQM